MSDPAAPRPPLLKPMLITAALAGMIAVLTLTPPSRDAGLPHIDKLFHFVAFAGLCLPMAIARPRWGLWIILSVAAYGGLIEVIQPHVSRGAEWLDLLADAMGATVGVGLGALWARRRA